MKTRKITVILSTICVFVLVIGFAACNDSPSNDLGDFTPVSQTLNTTEWAAFTAKTSPKLAIDTVLTAGNYIFPGTKTLNTDGHTLTVNSGARLAFQPGAKYEGNGSIVIQPGGMLYDLNPASTGVWNGTNSTGSIVINYDATAYTGGNLPANLAIGSELDSPSRVILNPGSSLTMKAKGYVVSGRVRLYETLIYPLSTGFTLTGVNGAVVEIPQNAQLGYYNDATGCIPGIGDTDCTSGSGYKYIDTSGADKKLTWTKDKWVLSDLQ